MNQKILNNILYIIKPYKKLQKQSSLLLKLLKNECNNLITYFFAKNTFTDDVKLFSN